MLHQTSQKMVGDSQERHRQVTEIFLLRTNAVLLNFLWRNLLSQVLFPLLIKGLVEELRQALIQGMSQNPPEEYDHAGLVEGPQEPLFIEANSLIDKVQSNTL